MRRGLWFVIRDSWNKASTLLCAWFIFFSPAILTAQVSQTNQITTAGSAASAKPSQPFVDIGTFQFVPESIVAGRIAGSTAIAPPALRVEFKIKDKSIDHLNTATIYLFDKDRKPLKTLTEIDPSGFLPVPTGGGTPRKPAGRFPNMIHALYDLKPGTPYNLIFPSPDKKDWKIAVAVIGNTNNAPSCVYKTIPAVVDVKSLDFKEKAFAIKN